ncbi:MAG TPA: carboxylesterase/lipase family protein [Actinomycetota bacterium]|jgi:para-nitrobenzyl esterase|nr:carboxylesterase/lipase family protein [Actinomycetota bacterium]
MIVQTSAGKVGGIEKMGCLQFRGVPFAQPPVGELRWKSPRPHQSWDGTRECTEFGPICPQVAGTMERLTTTSQVRTNPMSEDCLTLNVFTPAADDGARPVMVWIHGGGFSTGSGRLPWYYGHNFCRDGVVVVTINYRVNAFGFLELGELFGASFAETGTLGIQDQVAALQWVHENIAAFGGDPGNVTIFGESAGGGSVGTLLATPSAQGLFHKAIPQSGAAHWSLQRDVASRITERLLAAVGVKPGDTDALLALDAESLTEGVGTLGTSLSEESARVFGDDFDGAAMVFQPVWGGDVLPRPSIDAIAGGSAAGIPTLVGTTKEEWKLFTLGAKPGQGRVRAVRPLRNLCERKGRSVDELIGFYEKQDGVRNEIDLRNAVETDRTFRIPAIRLAEAQVDSDTPSWMYRFDWPSPAFNGAFGACHALEIPFVFDNLSAPGVDIFTGGEAPQEIATAMHAAWVSFAKTGDPGWPRYDTDRRATMLFDVSSGVADDPDGDTRRLWDGLL